jgi:hypothetical protein
MTINELVPAGDEVSQAIREIESTLRERPNEYWGDTALQARYRGLIEAREGKAPPPAAPSEVDAEIAGIQRLMRTGEYWQRHNEPIRQRYLELLREREGQDEAPAATEEEWRRPADEATRADLGPAVVAELERTGDFADGLRALQDDVLDMLASVNEGGAVNDFVAAFDGLPDAIQSAVYLEFARGAPTFAPLATDEQLDLLVTELPAAGPALLAAWGSQAGRKLGIACARWQRCLSGLSEGDQAKLRYFVDHSQPVEQAAVFWHLAGD